MPISTMCVSTINSRPRTWSSYTNIRAKDVQGLGTMNSAEEISKYKEPYDSYYSPTLSRRLLGYGYELPDKSPKKEKKWSIGSLFRRKKKDESGGDSSTGEDDGQKKSGFLRKRKKPEKKRKHKTLATFDHVVIPPNTYLYTNGNDNREILSDSAGINNYIGRLSPNLSQETKKQSLTQKNSRESLDDMSNSLISLGSDSVVPQKNKKDIAKIRAEARRLHLKRDSSSDEDSQRSASSASKFRSDESLGILNRENSGNRRSRAARTERYLRRHSKDGENPNARITKADIDNSGLHWKLSDDSNRSLSRSPLVSNKLRPKNSYSSLSSHSPSISGLSTIPPSHGSHSKIRVSNSTSNPSYKPPTSINDYNFRKYDQYFNNQRSVSCDANIHQAPSNDRLEAEVIHVQFPISKANSRHRNLSLINTNDVNLARQPPPPPPRDPKRLVTTQYYDNGRPTTYYFDNANRSKSFYTQSQKQDYAPSRKLNSFNLHTNGRSTSEDQLIHHSLSNIPVLPRPSSATPEANSNQKKNNLKPDFKVNQECYNYLMDKKPRSRRPIFIQTNDSHTNQTDRNGAQKALDFWKQKDKEQFNAKNKSNSPQMFTCQTQVQTQIFLPSVLQTDLTINNNDLNDSKLDDEQINDEEMKRKSANLEEALDELEAIYNSLKLGDEDLLERAEQREKDAVNNLISPAWAPSRGTLSDSSFSYEPFDTINSPRRKRLSKKAHTIDRRNDDMAFRKLNKERAHTINNPQSVVSNVSYLETCPVYGKEFEDNFTNNRNNTEPDITLDDVVYRNVKYANSSPKVVEPQPPFGIPLGPITLASNSDYLHAVPEDFPRPTFKPRKIPDLVKDDLAFRNLRKDENKEPILPPLCGEDVKNNNSKLDLNSLKKKRAVRSLSANIGSLINKDVLARGLARYKQENNNSENELNTLTDIADAMEIARQVLREKENKINNTRKAFLSDTETNSVENRNSSSHFGKLTERRLNFLNSLKTPIVPNEDSFLLNTKPPRGLTPERRCSTRSPKESTPIPISPLERERDGDDCHSYHKSFDDLLTVLATEARETSERITKELQDFDEKSQIISDNVSEEQSKLMEGVVDSTDFMSAIEEVQQLEPCAMESVANVVVTRDDSKTDRIPEKIESDHDYENLMSDKELSVDEMIQDDDVVNKCTSPFEEHKAELIASFQELKKNIDLDIAELRTKSRSSEPTNEKNNEMRGVEGGCSNSHPDGRSENDKNYDVDSITGKHSHRRSRYSRLPRWLRPRSYGSLSDPAVMSEGQENRAERIARYKEERRKQLAAQFSTTNSDPSSKKFNKDSSSSEGPRTTKASRLRAAASSSNQQENCSSPSTQANKLGSKEKLHTSSSGVVSNSNRCYERDKSAKRKSNLNRSLNCEEVPNSDSDNVKARRRRRRFFSQEVLEQSIKLTNDDNTSSKSDTATSSTATTSLPQFSATSQQQSQVSSNRTTPTRKSELSIHMENARRGITAPYSEMGRHKSPTTTTTMVRNVGCSTKISSVKERSPKLSSSSDTNERDTKRNILKKDTIKQTTSKSNKTHNVLDNDPALSANRNIAKKMEELTALTRETLARVERLATKKDPPRIKTSSPVPKEQSSESTNRKSSHLSSILKKKCIEESPPQIVEISVPNHTPVSILKRKVSQDEQGNSNISTHTPPVTFSPSVIEPTTTNRKQGILKKRRSLDESQVMRHRSCSPDVVSKTTDSRSILKNQRRSSLEELRHTTTSPETQLHGILKRKSLKNDDDESLNSPQSILKRKSGASSAGSINNNTPHVSITTAVILAAAGGAEMVLESPTEPVKPILKKKSFSEENTYNENSTEVPKPILKKKSSTDTDDCDDRPKRPILKIARNSLEETTTHTTNNHSLYYKHLSSDNDSDFKPILRQNSIGASETSCRPRLSFCSDSMMMKNDDFMKKPHRRSYTISSTDYDLNRSSVIEKSDDRELKKPRPLSVSELVMNFESSVSTGAIPKRSNLNRQNDRYKTQPITSNELEASLNFVERTQFVEKTSDLIADISNDLFNFTTSLENDSDLNSFLTSSFQNISPDSGVKMSSDSAFQSLGDGLELDQDDNKSPEPSIKHQQPSQLELNMKALAEEAKKMRLGKFGGKVLKEKNRRSTDGENTSRFSTQPVTFDEVQEAARMNKNTDESGDQDDADPCKLSLFERIQLFSEKIDHTKSQKRSTKYRYNRCQTLPITSDEVESARFHPIKTRALDDSSDHSSTATEKRGILKSNSTVSNLPPKSVLKKRTTTVQYDRASTKKTDVLDEGISCNDSGSDSEIAISVPYSVVASSKNNTESGNNSSSSEFRHRHSPLSKVDKLKYSSETSDGESSGGREVQSIFKNENKLKVKLALEAVLSKSKSQGKVGGDETEPSIRKPSNIRRSQTQAAMPRKIAELQAKLQQNGESSWKKRIQQNNNSNDELQLLKDKNKYNDELSEKSILALKKDELDAASNQWKSRVEKSDAEKFSVLGRMEKNKDGKLDDLPINIPLTEKEKRTPQAKRFKGKDGCDSFSTPVSPDKCKNHLELIRSSSVPEREHDTSRSDKLSTSNSGRKVAVVRPDDFTFKNFYKSIEGIQVINEILDVSVDDLDAVTRQSLLVQRKNVQVQRRRGASRNPIKALASRTDIADEYTEIITGVAEREKKRLNIEKLAKGSNLAVEALAGLASKEDFTAVALKKSSSISTFVPFKNIMLLQVKGRRHVQTRLVEPTISSINEGDTYILITSNALYNYIGAYANVIEQSRASDIVNHIQQTGDLGCKVNEVITINTGNSASPTKAIENFWKLLGCTESQKLTDGGNPSEDEIYETNILATNMIYKLEENELVPLEEYWGTIPKIEMLEPTKVIVFDFGTEMYVWSGKNASLDKKRRALKLAQELWDEGYNYQDCNVCPLNVATILGDRPINQNISKKGKRPDWALFAKLTQHRETILFKEKFLDWPDFSRIIKVKGDENDKFVDASYDIRPCNVDTMLIIDKSTPDLIVEGNHLGRGNQYFDDETKRLFEFETLTVTMWRILENNSEKLCDKSVGHFYDSDSYIIRWNYRMTVKGRELSGKPSKFGQAGRDRTIYFCWQGTNSSVNEKGYAALLTVELDNESAPQIRVVQGFEPAAFLGIFNGTMVVHKGKRDDADSHKRERLYIIKGDLEAEVCLVEVPCNSEQLRSRTSFLLIDCCKGEIIIWHGTKSTTTTRKLAETVAEFVSKKKASEFYLDELDDIDIVTIEEGDETQQFLIALGNDVVGNYFSLSNDERDYDFTMRLFNLTSISGTFEATEILCPYRSQCSSPFPFLQTELYSASQPALFLIDNHHELWLWQGWWPETEEYVELSDQTGSGAVRWQAERKAAMQTCVDYWRKSHGGDECVPAYLVWAGLEPLQFKTLFPSWQDRNDVADLNLKEGKRKNSKLLVEKELARLSRTTYSLAELLQRPLPEGVDPTHLENYLCSEDFVEALGTSKEEFQQLPVWKQTAIKKDKGLF